MTARHRRRRARSANVREAGVAARRLAAAAMIAVCGALVPGPAAPAEADGSGLSVDGNRLLLDGQPFLARGLNAIGVLAPAWCTTGQGVAARDHFGQAEIDAAEAWNANTLRLQVSQRGIADPAVDQAQRDDYLRRVTDAVALARSNGFVVDISLQDQANGCGMVRPLPSAESVSAWSVLAPQFADDPSVMFELYNEPNQANTAEGWNQWQNGGDFPNTNGGETAVGEQTLVDTIRSLGASNVIIVDGLSRAEQLSGMPLLSDPLQPEALVYGIHPYAFTRGQTWWEQQYGYLTPSKPVIATEWSYTAKDCGTAKEALAPSLLAYLRDHDIGLVAHALDVPGHTIADWTWRPTQCGTAVGGSGQLTMDYFASPDGGTDTTPPTAPSSLASTLVDDTSVSLSWAPSTDDSGYVNYQVFRDGSQVATTDQTQYTDAGLTPSTSYDYAVVAVDRTGNTSPASTPLSVVTSASSDTTAPTTPTALTGRLLSPTSSVLTWTPSTDDVAVAGYAVSRNGAVVATTQSVGYTDNQMPSNQTNTYTVAALDGAGNISPASNQAQVIAPATAANGLSGTYFASATLSNPKVSRIDPQVSFSWGSSAPARGVPADKFSVRWAGQLIPPGTGSVTIYAQSDNGIRVWIDGTLIINDWTAHALRERSAAIRLSADRAHSLRAEFHENYHSATARLSWSSASMSKQVIPTTQLLAQ